MDENQQKICPKCGETKNIDQFYKCKSRKDGHTSWCKKCSNKSHKQYVSNNVERIKKYDRNRYWENPEKRREIRRKSNQKNAESIKLAQKLYRQENHEEILNKNRKYANEHREEINLRNRLYYKSHKDDFVFKARERKQKIRETKDGTITKESLNLMFENQKHKCAYCECDLNIYAKHLDHIFPLSKGGIHTIGNVHWVCKKCNLSKSDKTEEEWFDMLIQQGKMVDGKVVWDEYNKEGNDMNESA